MIKDIIASFNGNLKQKTTNPFFGTFILIWIYKNWVIVYAVFNFDDGFTLENRINFIRQNISNESLLLNLGWSILWTFVVLIISYILVNLSRLIINFFEKRVTPRVYKITDSKDIVLKTDFDNLVVKSERLKERFEEERTNRIKAEEERDELEKRIVELITEKQTQNGESDRPTSGDDGAKEETQWNNIAENLRKRGILDKFETVIERVDNRKSFDQNDAVITYLLKIGLVEKGQYVTGGNYLYTFSEEGIKFKRFYVNKFLLNR